MDIKLTLTLVAVVFEMLLDDHSAVHLCFLQKEITPVVTAVGFVLMKFIDSLVFSLLLLRCSVLASEDRLGQKVCLH